MEKSIATRIIEFLKTNVELHDVPQRRTFLCQAIPDYHRLCGDINFQGSAKVFLSLLIEKLVSYSIHSPEEDLIIAVLKTVRSDVGLQAQDVCNELLQEWMIFCQQQKALDTKAIEYRDYKYDVFLSYDEEYEWWVDDVFFKNFKELLEHYLERPSEILPVRERDKWTRKLKRELLLSRCVVPIWYPSRFKSTWWIYECSVMRSRETQLKRLRPEESIKLILPVLICDCKKSPEFVQTVPGKCKLDDMLDYVVKATALHTTGKIVEFRDKIKRWIETAVLETINQTSWKEEWLDSNDEMSIIPQESISASEQSRQTFEAIYGRRYR